MIAKISLTLASMAAVLLAMPVLAPLISGDGWWWTGLICVVVVALTGIGVRAVRITVVLVPLVQALTAVCALTAMFAPEQAVAGIIPTPSSLDTLLSTFADGQAEIDREPSPISPSAGVTLIIATCLGLVAIVADFLAVTARASALVILPLTALLIVPLVVEDQGVDWAAFAFVAVGYVLLLAVDGWTRNAEWGTRVGAGHDTVSPVLGGLRHVLTSAGVAAVAIALALLLPLAVPGLSSNSLYAMADGSRLDEETMTTTHPLVSLRRDLTSTSDRPVLEYRTSTPRPDYLRMYVLDTFDGENWTMSSLRADSDNLIGGGPLPAPPGQTDPTGDRVMTRVTLAEDTAFDFLPVPYPPSDVTIDGEWFADPESLMVFSTREQEGLEYEVDSYRPAPDAPSLRRDIPPSADLDRRYLAVPEEVDSRVEGLTRSIVSEAETPYESAMALQNWFTADGRFDYDLRPPPIPQGEDPLAYFLFDSRIGYCEQFAAAMTLMARQAGIPARVAIGYTSGTRGGDGTWQVSGSDAHAWPELYFEGQGWLRFEPTPASSDGQGSASVPSYADPASGDGAETSDASPTPAESPEDSAPAEEGVSAAESEPSEEPSEEPSKGPAASGSDDENASGGLSDSPRWWTAALAGAAVLLLAAVPALARSLVRRFRWATAAQGAARAHAAWSELCDDTADLGLVWNTAKSPRAVAHRLGSEVPHSAREALWRIAMAEESARYAPRPEVPKSLDADCRTVRAALRAAQGPGVRLRAALLPASVLRIPWSGERRPARPKTA